MVGGTGGNMVECGMAQVEIWWDGTGGNMVWHRWKYGGVVTIELAKSKSWTLFSLDLT